MMESAYQSPPTPAYKKGDDPRLEHAPPIAALRGADDDRSFGCLNDDLYSPCAPSRDPDADHAPDDAPIGPDEFLFLMPKDDLAAFMPLCDAADDHPDPDAINAFWMGLGKKLGFCWSTVRALRITPQDQMAFIAQPDGQPSIGPIEMDDDPADAFLAGYCGKMNPDSMRFRGEEMRLAFNAGVQSANQMEFEIDGEMLPADQAAEALLAQLDDMRNAIRDARDTLSSALDDDDDGESLFASMTIDGEGIS